MTRNVCRWLAALAVWLLITIVVGPVTALGVLWFAGPHSGLTGALSARAILIGAWLVVLLFPASVARAWFVQSAQRSSHGRGTLSQKDDLRHEVT